MTMATEPEEKKHDHYRCWVKEVYEPWYASTLSGDNGPPPPPPVD
jgi:hypothetical protein